MDEGDITALPVRGLQRYSYRPMSEALRDLAYILDHLNTPGPLKMGVFITNEVAFEDPGVVHFYPTKDQAGALVQAVNRAAEQRLTWEEDLLSAPALVLRFGKYLELSMEVK